MNLSRFGEDGIRILFGDAINPDVHEKVRNFYFYVKSLHLREIIDITPSFHSCLIHFDPEQASFARLSSLLVEKEDEALRPGNTPAPALHEIPVHYGGKYALDMSVVCEHTGLAERDIIEIHAGILYIVFAVGFLPGFPYLGTLDQRLHVPRLETPRIRVPAGSVGIAQLQTGIYSFPSPAGWRIIGRTDVSLFNHQKEPYSLLQIGDKVKFTSL
jgi:inhibitor of KinA